MEGQTERRGEKAAMVSKLTAEPELTPTPTTQAGHKTKRGGGPGASSTSEAQVRAGVTNLPDSGKTTTEARAPRTVALGTKHNLCLGASKVLPCAAWEIQTQKQALENLLKCLQMMQNSHCNTTQLNGGVPFISNVT